MNGSQLLDVDTWTLVQFSISVLNINLRFLQINALMPAGSRGSTYFMMVYKANSENYSTSTKHMFGTNYLGVRLDSAILLDGQQAYGVFLEFDSGNVPIKRSS